MIWEASHKAGLPVLENIVLYYFGGFEL